MKTKPICPKCNYKMDFKKEAPMGVVVYFCYPCNYTRIVNIYTQEVIDYDGSKK